MGAGGAIQSYVLAMAATLLSLVLRLSFDSLLGHRIPYAPFLFPVAWAAVRCGAYPALLSLVSGALLGTYWFVAPRFSMAPHGFDVIVGLILYLAIGVLLIGNTETQRRARLRAERAEAEMRVALAAAEDAQRTLQSLMEFVPEGISVVDPPDARLRMMSRAGLDTLGRPPDGMVDRTADDRARDLTVFERDGKTPMPRDRHPAVRALRGELVHDVEAVVQRADGTTATLLSSAAPIRDAQGQITGALSVFRDISERKRLEENLRETAKLESLGILAGGIAHDFNNLLTGILCNASMLAEIDPTSEAARTVTDAAERAARLVNEMLAYSGRGKFTIEPVDLSDLIRQTTLLIGSSLSKTVALQLDLADGLPPVQADAAQMQQLVMNLAINGAEAIGESEGVLRITTRVAEVAAGEPELTPGRYVSLVVEDTGCGMTPETMARIFDPFFTTKFTGRGLGLSAAQGIVRGHDGALRVASELGKGTRFTVLLPASGAETHASEALVFRPRTEAEGSGLVLVVDDEAIVRITARKALERRGYSVLEAENGADAVEAARRNGRIAAVLLDMTMPGQSCEETLEGLRGVPVVLTSGFSEGEALERFGRHGLSGFLQKPYTAERLLRAIEAAAVRS